MLLLVTFSIGVVWTSNLLAEERLPIRPEACIMPPPEGDCGTVQQNRWFFDAAGTGSCRQFLFYGCPAIGNNFETQEECNRICINVAAAGDDLQPNAEVQGSAETLSTFPVNPVDGNQHNGKWTTARLLGTIEEGKVTTGKVEPKIASPEPSQPSGSQKEPTGRVEVVEVVTDPNQKTTLSLAPEKNRKGLEGTSAQSKDLAESPGSALLLTPEMPQEPFAANDQPIPSNSNPGNAKRNSDSATPSGEREDRPEPQPSFEEPTPDDDQPGQTERSRPLPDQDGDSDTEEPGAGFQDHNRPTEPEQEAEQIGPKEKAEEEGNRGEDANENNSSETLKEPQVMPSREEVETTSSMLAILKQSKNVNELQSEFTPKLTFAFRGSTGTERAQQTETDNQGLEDDPRMMSTMKKTEQAKRNTEDSEQRKVRDQQLTERSRTEANEIPITRTVPSDHTTSALGVPITRSPPSVRVKSLVDGKTSSDDIPLDGTQEEQIIEKEGRRNIVVTHQIPDRTPLMDGFPDLASVLMSKTPKRTALNPSQRVSRSTAQPPVARTISMDGIPKNRENSFTGENKQISSGTLAVRARLEIPAMRLAKSEQDYRRPSFCSLHKVRGHCTEHLLRWYYNPFNGSCQSFTYSGCSGNLNNFETVDTCLETCTGRNRGISRPPNNLQADAPTLRIPTRFAEPNWSPLSASPAEPLPRQPDGLQFFLDALRGRLPPPPPPPPFLRSLAFPRFHSNSPEDNVADQKMSLGDMNIEDLGRPEEELRRAKESAESSDKRFHLSGRALENEPRGQLQKQRLHQPMVQRSRSSEFFRSTSNLPEKATFESDVATLRNLLHQDPRETPDSDFGPMPLGRNPEASSVQKSRPNGYSDARKADDTRETTKRGELDQSHLKGRFPVVQRTRTRQNRQSPAVGFHRFGHSVNSGRHPPNELQNFRWIEQAIVASDLEPGRLHLPLWFSWEMIEKARPTGQNPIWRDPTGPRRPDGNSENPQNALTLRRNSMILETRKRVKKPQDMERGQGAASGVHYPVQERHSDRMAISSDRGLPRQPQKQLRSTSTSSSHSSPIRGMGHPELPLHVLHLPRPLVEQLAGRTGADHVEQDSRRPSQTETEGRLIGSREDHPRGERPNVLGRDKNWGEEDRERQNQRRRNNYNNNGFGNSFPNDRLTFLQIFVNRDQPGPANQLHFPKPSLEEKQYLSQSHSRPKIEAPQFQTNQHGGYFPPPPLPPPRQMSPRQRPAQISPETMTDERDWFHASEFDDGHRHKGGFVNVRADAFGSDPNEDSKDRRGNPTPFVCRLPLEPGSCAGYQARWFYNERKGSCELFYYGGCSGNGNRFETRDECLQTCDGETEQKTDETEPRSLDGSYGRLQGTEISSEDVIILTSPVYGEFEENVKDTTKVKVRYASYDHVGRPLMTTHAPFLSGHGKMVEELESHVPTDVHVDTMATERTTTERKMAVTDLAGKVGDAEAKKDDDLSKTFSTQYIAIVTALGVVGIAVVLMVILSIVRLCRRVKKSKREHCIQEVIKSHMYGDLPHVLYSESASSAASEKEKSDKK